MITTFFLVAGILLYTYKPSPVDRFALQFEDIKFDVRSSLGLAPKGDKNVVIVTVDEKSVNRLGRWPWDRKIVGDLFAGLKQANIIGLDIVFSEPTDSFKDAYLADKIAQNGNIILGFFFREKASVESTPEQLDLIEECSYFDYKLLDKSVGVKEFKYSETNLPSLSDSALTCAFFNSEPDPDGLYRRYPLAYVHQGYIFPPLAIQMLRFYLNQDAGIVLDKAGVVSFRLGDNVLSRSNYIRLNYYDPESFAVVSAVDILEGKIPPTFFKGKVVLVGVTEIGVFDMRPTPINPVTPGLLLHYAAFVNLMRNEMLHDVHWLDLVLLFFLLVAVLVISFRRQLFQRLALYFSAILCCGALSYYLFMGHLLWLREFYIITPAFFCVAALEAAAFVFTEARAGELKRAFAAYVSPEVVREILKDPDRLKLGGGEREISVLFSDIRKFTTLSESVSPVQLVQLLTQIHDPMTNIVLKNKGMLDKYIGDAMMALFNTPLDVENHADKAVGCGLEMIGKLKEINSRFKKLGVPAIDVGIGINTGKCVVGNMGSRVRFEYTAIGDAVNLASRLEGLCKTYMTHIMISEFTRKKLVAPFLVRKLDKVCVKGKKVPVKIYEVMEDTVENLLIKNGFEKGLERYFAGDFDGACLVFEELEKQQGDPVSRVFSERCRVFMQSRPAPDWDGVFILETK